jgi:DDE superfamily endonuclease
VGPDFVAAMEDVLDLYAEPYDATRPVVCLDEKPVVLRAETRPSLPPAPGRLARHDYEYERGGSANLFVTVEPLAGWRHIEPTERRTHREYAQILRYLVEEAYPEVAIIRVVQDNLSTHNPSSLYATFPPEQARSIRRRLEFHPTPTHGSWLNMAEIEIGIVQRGCLSRPVGNLPTLARRVRALETERNRERRTISWQFTTTDARQKLERLYPPLKTELD